MLTQKQWLNICMEWNKKKCRRAAESQIYAGQILLSQKKKRHAVLKNNENTNLSKAL